MLQMVTIRYGQRQSNVSMISQARIDAGAPQRHSVSGTARTSTRRVSLRLNCVRRRSGDTGVQWTTREREIIIARQHALHAESDIVLRLQSVRLSVHSVPVSCLNECTCRLTFCSSSRGIF